MADRSITQRWLVNTLGVVIAILVVIELGVIFFVRNYYYNDLRMQLYPIMVSVRSSLNNYTERSEREFNAAANQVVENFQQKEKLELMIIDREGRPFVSTTGFIPPAQSMPDYDLAKNDPTGNGNISEFTLPSGENVMAYTTVLMSGGNIVGAARLVVSLELVDQQIFIISSVVLSIGIAIILFVITSGLYFIRSIVTPIREIGQTARRIALGDFDHRLQKKRNDEIGELCEAINYMAGELAASEKMKNDFISSVSHELRTPLTAIKGWGETLRDGSIDSETMRRGMGVISSEAERLSGIVEELLDFSRLQSGRMKLKLDRIDILAELSEAVFMFKERALREGIDLIYHEPEIVSPVLGDRNRLRQVFVNILDNALKYSDPGGRVRVEISENGDTIGVLISDTGCGIPAEDMSRVKEKFFKSNQTRRGSGIGLAVADEIVSLHGGTLDIMSTPGSGTDVLISLPAATTEETPPLPFSDEASEKIYPYEDE